MFQQALKIRMSTLGLVHPDVASTYWNWADNLKRAGRVLDARPKWLAACEVYRASLGAGHPTYQKCVNWWKH